ncbi:MAG: S8 family serine peptidase [Opitutales bacterium]|nr:S8 family serine peptidase [Opitutales bacterium]
MNRPRSFLKSVCPFRIVRRATTPRCLLFIASTCAFATAQARLLPSLEEAYRSDDLTAFTNQLRLGADPNSLVAGVPLLHQAAEDRRFEYAKHLLWRGADVLAKDAHGHIALDRLTDLELDDESLELHYLLRAHALVREHARPAQPITRPNLVILFEPTVDYLHPEIAPHYYVNSTELSGSPGVDDDANGFTDDVYGWTIRHERPHLLTPIQEVILRSRSAQISRLLGLYSRIVTGELTVHSPEVQALHRSFTNPIAGLFGRSMGFSDFAFMKHLVELSHGTHVAGVVIEASKREALVHTLSWDGFEDGGEWYTEVFPSPRSGSFDDYVKQLREDLLPELMRMGLRGSDYIRATGAGVVNGSFGLNFEGLIPIAQRLATAMVLHDPENLAQFNTLVVRLAIELYAYLTVPYVMVVGENPDVFFVAAAGNSSMNNDLTLQSPAYLSRFFPNLITVAAEAREAGEGPSVFTNFGAKSVNIATPGTAIQSLGVGGTRVRMDGTSQAAPRVAGLAAMVRHRRPDISAVQLRRGFEFTANREEAWEGLVSDGVLNEGKFMVHMFMDRLLRVPD